MPGHSTLNHRMLRESRWIPEEDAERITDRLFTSHGVTDSHLVTTSDGDVVINNYSDAAGMRPVVFPHWFHRVRFRCKVCHADLGFQFKAGGNQINMLKIIDGQYCGSCHNGELAWSAENCNLCHSGKPGTPTQVHESTLQKLGVPPAPAAAASVATSAPPPAPAKK